MSDVIETSQKNKEQEELPRTFPQKYRKKLQEWAEGYMENVEAASSDDIKKLILTSENNIYDIEHDMDSNPDLVRMKEELKEATAPYKEAKQSETAKIKFCLFKLNERNVKF